MLTIPLFSEIEHDMEAIALLDGSKKRKVRFRSKSESVVRSSSQTKKSSETKHVCQDPLGNFVQEQQSPQTEDVGLEIQHLGKGVSHKKGTVKKRGKPRKKVRLCLPKPRRLIKSVVLTTFPITGSMQIRLFACNLTC